MPFFSVFCSASHNREGLHRPSRSKQWIARSSVSGWIVKDVWKQGEAGLDNFEQFVHLHGMSQVQPRPWPKSQSTVAPGLGALLGHAGYGNWLGPLVDPRQSVELVPRHTGISVVKLSVSRGCTRLVWISAPSWWGASLRGKQISLRSAMIRQIRDSGHCRGLGKRLLWLRERQAECHGRGAWTRPASRGSWMEVFPAAFLRALRGWEAPKVAYAAHLLEVIKREGAPLWSLPL